MSPTHRGGVQLDWRRTLCRRAGGCCHHPPHRASQPRAEPEIHLPCIDPVLLPLCLVVAMPMQTFALGWGRSCLPHMGYLLQAVTSPMMTPLLPVTPSP